MTFYDEIKTDTRERTTLSPGTYGSGKEAGLKIVAYPDSTEKFKQAAPDKNGAIQHSLVVAATRASKEAKEAFVAALKAQNGYGNPLDAPDFEGTTFLKIVLHPMWLNPESLALAFTEASRNKDGEIQADYVTKAIQSGETTQENMDRAKAHWQQVATEKVLAANTPDDQVQEKMEEQYRKELIQISIKIGNYFRLLDWAGIKRNPNEHPMGLVGKEFAGKVESREFNGKTQSEVTQVFSKK